MEYYVTVKNNKTGDIKTWTIDVSDLVTNVTQYMRELFSDFNILMIERKF
jgi:hypothetical protein